MLPHVLVWWLDQFTRTHLTIRSVLFLLTLQWAKWKYVCIAAIGISLPFCCYLECVHIYLLKYTSGVTTTGIPCEFTHTLKKKIYYYVCVGCICIQVMGYIRFKIIIGKPFCFFFYYILFIHYLFFFILLLYFFCVLLGLKGIYLEICFINYFISKNT